MHHAAPNARTYADQLCPNLDPNGPVSIDETLAYHGANFADLVETSDEASAWQRWKDDSRQAFLPVNFMQRVLAEFSPDVVITTNSPRTERAAIMAAGELGIPALCMVDMFALQEVKWIGKPGFADRVTVLNDAVRQMFIDHGRRPEDVVVTGNPAFDVINAHSTISAGAALRNARKWDDGRLNILWASTVEPQRHPFTGEVGDPELPRRVEACLREIVSRNENLRLIVRYHPSENITFEPAPNVELSPVDEPLHAVLHAIDAVVVTASTVGLEAWLAKRPVLSVDGSIFTADAPFAKMGIAQGVSTLEKLAELLQDMAGKQIAFPLSGQLSPPSLSATAKEAVVMEIEKISRIQRSV
ncbi:MAG: hypothetical protein KA312_02185 [Sphingorhabdus sp.]|nr:hypothetical protein [Sphingorhabdus sp.]